MSHAVSPAGRRERNKQQKLDRITAAASELFAERGVDEVTTQQIAERADIGAGTLFLYTKSKGELLLLVQNAHYAAALDRGVAEAMELPDALPAVMAIVTRIVECNRVQVDNGRTYLREMLFGDPAEPQHARAHAIVAQTERAFAHALLQGDARDERTAASLATTISAIVLVTLAATANARFSVAELVATLEEQIGVIVPTRD